MTLDFDERDLSQARRLNSLLAWSPRLRIRTRFDLALLQRCLMLGELISTPRLRRSGLVVENRRIEALGRSVAVRIIRPPQDCRAVYLDIHGGGFALGIPAMDDGSNARLARECGFATVSVDYRRIPHFPLSAAIEDCETAAAWVLENAVREFGTEKCFLGGESAGAYLAASTALRAQRFGRFSGVVLFYGIYDLSGCDSLRRAGPKTLVLHGPTLGRSLDWLMRDRSVLERRHPSISPLYADLKNLPPALFIVGAGDPLIDDSVRMEERWRLANGNSELVVVPAAPHAFNRLRTRIASKTNAYVRTWLTRLLFAGSQ